MELAIIIFLLIIIGVLFILNRKNSVATDIPLPYHKKFLLTKNEWSFYKNLKKITDRYGLHILAKVRVADLVDVKKGPAINY